MYQNEKLYDYLMEHTDQLTEEWYNSVKISAPEGIYSSPDSEVINNLKRQNNDFHRRFFAVFNSEINTFENSLKEWIDEIAKDEEHLNTPLHLILNEFNRTEEQYFNLLDQYVDLVKNDYAVKEVINWYRVIGDWFREIAVRFVEEHTRYAKQRIEAQEEVIMELSSPVISLSPQVALLPLVGNIDSFRSKIILDKTIDQCSKQRVNYLLLDLSGVVTIDEIVAEELMHLIRALKLIGVTTTLSGMRPELARSTVQLGIMFEEVTIKPSLAEAIQLREFTFK
ncbi:STAS domain-containing protein [Salipaludibacillus sp. CUR1]|uniref:STAS domain-containing protein n=1 Tax=Salipaludibacillus sp. CUR1 TaxID=2820003 RepID=UPI001E5EAEC8|nr:STAS domain-containing protein [Salipaludibacillus sp. CUR1]MCE7794446.1 STAS domain-containing protein [Salipaludibacillus sp. CUR1]